MASARPNDESLMLTGENMDAILDALDEEEEIQWYFEEESEEVQIGQFICSVCNKECKSKGGLSRHSSSKHNVRVGDAKIVEELSVASLVDVVTDAVTTASRNKCIPLEITEEVRGFPVILTEESALYKDIQGVYKDLRKHGDAEKFYTVFYSKIVLCSRDYFAPLTDHASTLLATKVADSVLIYYKKSMSCDETPMNPHQMHLSREEKDGLGYLGGYVFHNLYRKLKKSKNYKTKESQDSMQILKAGKIVTKEETTRQSPSLVTTLNRGGLWDLKASPKTIFEIIESNFRKNVASCGQRKIDTALIVDKCIKDPDIVSHFKTVIEESEIDCISDILETDLLTSIVKLYVRVRSFSYAKDVIQRFKVKTKLLKSKGLRKEIKRSSNEPKIQN